LFFRSAAIVVASLRENCLVWLRTGSRFSRALGLVPAPLCARLSLFPPFLARVVLQPFCFRIISFTGGGEGFCCAALLPVCLQGLLGVGGAANVVSRLSREIASLRASFVLGPAAVRADGPRLTTRHASAAPLEQGETRRRRTRRRRKRRISQLRRQRLRQRQQRRGVLLGEVLFFLFLFFFLVRVAPTTSCIEPPGLLPEKSGLGGKRLPLERRRRRRRSSSIVFVASSNSTSNDCDCVRRYSSSPLVFAPAFSILLHYLSAKEEARDRSAFRFSSSSATRRGDCCCCCHCCCHCCFFVFCRQQEAVPRRRSSRSASGPKAGSNPNGGRRRAASDCWRELQQQQQQQRPPPRFQAGCQTDVPSNRNGDAASNRNGDAGVQLHRNRDRNNDRRQPGEGASRAAAAAAAALRRRNRDGSNARRRRRRPSRQQQRGRL
jgi:hypothetical protein